MKHSRQLSLPAWVRFACASWLIAAGFMTHARAADSTVETITLDLKSPGPTISPLLFAFNLEHTRYSMWKGLSAQLLANRKLAGMSIAVGPNHPRVERGAEGPDGVAARWYGIGK